MAFENGSSASTSRVSIGPAFRSRLREARKRQKGGWFLGARRIFRVACENPLHRDPGSDILNESPHAKVEAKAAGTKPRKRDREA